MKDISGQRFGRLVAIRPTEMRKNRYIVWECACDCGNTAYVRLSVLTGGYTKSCGCLNADLELKRKDISGQRFGRLIAIRPTEQRRNNFVVWECICDCGNTAYVASSMLTCGNTRSCGCLRKETASKIHTFMPVTRKGEQEEGAGRNVRINNTSGYPGIAYRESLKKYAAEIGFQWKTYYLGAYQNIDDAIDVRKKAEALIQEQGRGFYTQWKEQAEADPAWAREHPIRICVTREEEQGYSVAFSQDIGGLSIMKDLTGQRFGRLVAIRPTEQRRNGAVVWECACDCGNTAYTSGNDLSRGKTRSCGCLRRDTAAQVHKFDPAANDGTQEKDAGQTLRKNNTTGRRGIGYRPKMGKYIARVGFHRQSYYLGAYQSIEDAIDVRKKAEALIWEKGDRFYAGWKEQAETDPAWAREHPIQIRVIKKEEERGYSVSFSPEL